VAGGVWAVSVLCGPVDGLLARVLRRGHLAG
jgi:zinc/manganese transport system permease protein